MNRFLVIFAAVCLAALSAAGSSGQPIGPDSYSGLRWRNIGPFRAGWSTCAEGIPDQPDVFYFGAAVGGVWTTDDAGRTWEPLFQHESTSSVDAIALAPSNPKILYVGTGQVETRYDLASGDGVFRSDDGGRTWRHLGLSATRAIGRISSIRGTRTRCSSRRWDTSSARTRSEVFSAPRTGERAGRKRCLSTRTPARSISRPIRRTRRSSMPRSGRCAITRGFRTSSPTWDPGAESTNRRTAERPGNGCRAAAGRRAAASAGSGSRSRRAGGCTRPSTRAPFPETPASRAARSRRPASTAPTTAALRGSA